MKKIIAILICMFFALSINAQQMYFSNQPFELGRIPDASQCKSDFETANENIYGVLILDSKIKSKHYDYRFFNGAKTQISIKSLGKEDAFINFKSLVHTTNEKTFIYYDIFPDTTEMRSEDANDWRRYLVPTMGKYVVKFESISGDDRPIPEQNLGEEITIKVKGNNVKERGNQIYAKWKLLEKYYYEKGKLLATETATNQDEMDRKNGSLPNDYKFQNSKPLVDLAREDVVKIMRQYEMLESDQQVKNIIYPENWEYWNGKAGSYRTIMIKTVFVDNDGNCAYQNLFLKSRKISENKYSDAVLDPNKVGKKKYFKCE